MAAKTAYQETAGEASSTLLAKPTRAKMEVNDKDRADYLASLTRCKVCDEPMVLVGPDSNDTYLVWCRYCRASQYISDGKNQWP